MCNVRAEDRISAEELRTRFNLNKMRLCLQIEDYNDFSRIIGVVHVEPSRLVVVSPEGNFRKRGLR